MKVHVDFNHLPRLAREADSRTDQGLADGTAEITEEAQRRAPVGKTGALRASIHPVRAGKNQWTVQTNAYYADWVEYGTGVGRVEGAPGPPGRDTPWTYWAEELGHFVTTSGNPAQPFMRPAYEAKRREAELSVKKQFQFLGTRR